MTGARGLAVAAGFLAVLGASCGEASRSEAELSGAESERLHAWLACEECTEGQLAFIRDSLGRRARDPLRRILLDMPEEHLDVARRALAASERRRVDSSVDSAAYVDYYLDGYKAMLQRRAAVGLAALGDVDGLQQALDRASDLGYRTDVVEVVRQAIEDADPSGGPIAPGPLVVVPVGLNVAVGDSAYLSATAPTGVVQASSIVWTSADSAILRVTRVDEDSAVVVGVTPGVAVVTATAGPASDSVAVTVVDSLPANPGLVIVSGDAQLADPAAATLDEPLVVRVTDASGAELRDVTVIWTVTRGRRAGTSDTTETEENGEASYLPPLPGVPEITWVEAEALGQRVRFTFRTSAP